MKKPIPLSDRILVRPNKPEQKKGVFVTPGAELEETLTGVVVAVGPYVSDHNIQPGVEVSWDKFSGKLLTEEVAGEKLRKFREDELEVRWEESE